LTPTMEINVAVVEDDANEGKERRKAMDELT
jgi:hypothetical protein